MPASNKLTRVNGTVVGASPGGVTVTLSPTSLVDEAAEGATFVDVVQKRSPIGKISASNVSFVRSGTVGSSTVSTVTSSDGSFAFGGVRTPGYYLLTFEKAGYQTKRYVISPTPGDSTPLKVTMAAGEGSLSGSVNGPSGPLGGVAITITDGTVTISTSTPTTGDVGKWSVSGVSTPGTYLVTATSNGFGAQSTLVNLAAGATLGGVNLTLQPGVEALTGTVSGPDLSGKVSGLGGITVTATNGKVTRTATTVTTGPVGQYTLPDLPVPSTYTVTFSADGYAVRTAQVDLTGDAPSHTLDALMSLSTATVTGTVTDSSGTGLVGAGVVLTGQGGTYKTTTVSDPAGGFRVTGVVPGSYVVSAQKFGYDTQYTQVNVTMGTPIDVPAIKLPTHPGEVVAATAHVQGIVIDASTNDAITCGQATCTYTVSTTEKQSDGSTKPFSTTVTVTSGGQNPQYALPLLTDTNGLLPGLHTLTVTAAGYETATVNVQVPLGGIATAPIVALHPSATLTGTISTVVGAVPANTCVVMVPSSVTPNGAPPCTPDTNAAGGCTSDAGTFCGIVDSKNQYTVRPNHGSYQVWVVPGDTDYLPTGPVFISLDVSEVKAYNATLNRLGRLQVFVQKPDPAGNLVLAGSGVTVTATQTGNSANTVTATTGSTSGALLTGLLPGTYTVQATEGTDLSGVVTVGVALNSDGSAATTVVMTATIEGVRGRLVYLVDGSPQPIANATVTLTGVWFYWGTTPYKISLPVVTDSNGCFAFSDTGAVPADVGTGVCETGNVPTTWLPIVTPYVDVSLTLPTGYPAFTPATFGVSSSSLLTVTAGTPPRTVSGTVTVAGGGSPDLSAVQFEVSAQPGGSGTVKLSSDSTGTISWYDSSEGNQLNVAWPGTYTIQASMSGYDSAPQTFTIDAKTDGSTYTLPTFQLEPYGALLVGAVDQNGDPIKNNSSTAPNLTFTLNGQTLSPTPGQSTVKFANLSSNKTYNVTVQAAGYQFKTSGSLSVTAGDTNPTTPQNVTLSRDGAIAGTVYAVTYKTDGTTQISKSAIGGVKVSATDGTDTFSTTSAADGSYRITGTAAAEGLNTGTWTVTTDAVKNTDGTTAYAATSASVDVTSTSSDTSNDILIAAQTATLTIVVQSDDKPAQAIAGATVTLQSTATGTLSPTTTSGNSYTFSNLPPISYSLNVTATNYSPVNKTETVSPGQIATDYITMATQVNSFYGTVTGYQGTTSLGALEGALVTVTDSKGNTVGTDTTDADGGYQVSGLKSSTGTGYTITVTATDYQAATKTKITVSGGTTKQVDVNIYLYSHKVTFTVSSSLASVKVTGSVTIKPQGSTGTQQTVNITTDVLSGNQVAVFNQVYPDIYDITVTGSGSHHGDFTPTGSPLTVPGDGTAQTPSITVNELELQISATANPPKTTLSTSVSVTPSGGSAVSLGSLTANGTSTLDVYFDSGNTYTVTASATGYSDGTYITKSGDTSDTVALVLNQTPGSMKVTVKDSANNLIDGATVSLSGGTNPPADQTTSSGVTTFQDDVLPGTYTVTVDKSGSPTLHGSATGQVVTSGNTTNAIVTIDDGSLTVTFEDSTGAAVSGATVTLSGGPTAGPTTAPTTNASGQVTFSSLAPGTYSVSITKSGSPSLSGSASGLVVSSNATTTPTVTVATGSMTITVTDTSNNPVSGATISLSGGPTGTPTPTPTTDANGKVTITGIAPGTYTVTVTSTPGGSATGVVVSSGADTPVPITVS